MALRTQPESKARIPRPICIQQVGRGDTPLPVSYVDLFKSPSYCPPCNIALAICPSCARKPFMRQGLEGGGIFPVTSVRELLNNRLSNNLKTPQCKYYHKDRIVRLRSEILIRSMRRESTEIDEGETETGKKKGVEAQQTNSLKKKRSKQEEKQRLRSLTWAVQLDSC